MLGKHDRHSKICPAPKATLHSIFSFARKRKTHGDQHHSHLAVLRFLREQWQLPSRTEETGRACVSLEFLEIGAELALIEIMVGNFACLV